MPFSGRPSGARPGRKSNKGWSKRRWEEERRVEELSESDDDDEQGVEISLASHGFAGDELHFTGFDLGSGVRRRRAKHEFDDESDYSEEEGSEAEPVAATQGMQLMLREKEDFLVERALERIRRAQMLGKTNVTLTQQELDALERKRQQAPTPELPRLKKPSSKQTRKGDRKRNKSERSSGESPQLNAVELRRPGKSSRRSLGESQPPYPMAPGEPYGNNPALVHGHYGSPVMRPSSSSSRQSSRNASNQSLRQPQQMPPPIPPYQHPYMQGRYHSLPEGARGRRPSSSSSRASSRPDPTDPNWEPRARSSSTILPYPLDPQQYAAYYGQAAPLHFDPRDPRFASPGRRVASGPPEVYPAQAPQGFYRYPQEEMFPASSSDPTLSRLRREAPEANPSSSSESSSSTDEDEDEGVQVEVVDKPTGGYDVQTRASASNSKSRGGGTSKRGRGKKT